MSLILSSSILRRNPLWHLLQPMPLVAWGETSTVHTPALAVQVVAARGFFMAPFYNREHAQEPPGAIPFFFYFPKPLVPPCCTRLIQSITQVPPVPPGA